MKKEMIFGIMFLLCLSMVMADGEVVGDVGNFDQYMALDNNEIVSQDLLELSLWDSIVSFFGGNELNFVTTTSKELQGDQKCELVNGFGSYDRYPNKITKSGSKCNVGDFIIFQSNGGDLPSGRIIFEDAWFKSSSSDLLDFNKYDAGDLTFQYSYACYECENFVIIDSEKGCLTTDKQRCVVKGSERCTDYSYEKNCLQFIVDKEECDYSNNPSERECENLRDDYRDGLNSCTGSDIINCYGKIPITTTTTTTTNRVTTTTIKDNKVSCYTCLNGESTLLEFANECPEGTSETDNLDCENPEKEVFCYYCLMGNEEQGLFPNECPEGTSANHLDSCPSSCDAPKIINEEGKCVSDNWFARLIQKIGNWFAKVF